MFNLSYRDERNTSETLFRIKIPETILLLTCQSYYRLNPSPLQRLYADIFEVAWPASVSRDDIDVLPDRSLKLTSVDEYAQVILGPSGQHFTVKFLCRLDESVALQPRQSGSLGHSYNSHWMISITFYTQFMIILSHFNTVCSHYNTVTVYDFDTLCPYFFWNVYFILYVFYSTLNWSGFQHYIKIDTIICIIITRSSGSTPVNCVICDSHYSQCINSMVI